MRISDWSSDVCSSDRPLKLLLLSDIHVAGPDMPPERLVRIVADLNQLKPNLVLIAGDLVREKRSAPHIYRSEERRVGKECVSPCRSRWSAYPTNKTRPSKQKKTTKQRIKIIQI